MPNYHVKVVKGRTARVYPCESPTITVVPAEGYYHDNPHLIDMPEGQRVKLDLEFINPQGLMERKIILIPQDGSVAYLMDEKGNTIETYPKKRDRDQREQKYGLKVGKSEA
jgi:hypothetical protein